MALKNYGKWAYLRGGGMLVPGPLQQVMTLRRGRETGNVRTNAGSGDQSRASDEIH